ncbi:MAG: energy-coupling factor transport system permease protein [Actinomycetota bacterium]|nr:energy-coupling factor transport system permease protein [Actinomycetota bacterium]
MTTTISAPTRRRINPRWRVVDIIIASVLGVASGVIFAGWDLVYEPVTKPLELLLPGSGALLYAVWLFPGVLGALVIRKPGAAIFTEVLAAVVESLLGGPFGGWQTIFTGIIQGIGAELVFLAVLYGIWRLWVAVLAGAASGVAMAVNDTLNSYAAAGLPFKVSYFVCSIVSGAVIAGIGSWYLVRALAKTGALSRFASGRTATT